MASIDYPPTGSRQSIADGLWRAAMVSLALVPLGMAIAHRSSPVFLILSTVFGLAAASLEGRIQPMLRQVQAALASPLGLAVIAFFAWCLVSIGWSEFRAVSFRAFGEFWLPVAAGLVLALLLPRQIPRRMLWLPTATVVLAGIIVMAELRTGMILRRAIGVRSDPYIFNRPTLTLLMLSVPLMAWFLGEARRGWLYVLGLLLFTAIVAIQSESDAAVLGLAIVCLAFPLAWYAPRLTFGLAALGFAAAVCLAPFIGSIAAQLITPAMQQKMASSHSKERIEIWQGFDDVVREKPLLGSGFGVSPRMLDTSVAKAVPAEHRAVLDVGHPHNAALQIWVELGAIGAALSLVIALLILRSMWRLPHLARSASLALMSGAAPVALVGHGAWQGWWAASLAAAIIWMQAVSRFQVETKP